MKTHKCICKKALQYQKSKWKYFFVKFNVIKNNLLTQFYIWPSLKKQTKKLMLDLCFKSWFKASVYSYCYRSVFSFCH